MAVFHSLAWTDSEMSGITLSKSIVKPTSVRTIQYAADHTADPTISEQIRIQNQNLTQAC